MILTQIVGNVVCLVKVCGVILPGSTTTNNVNSHDLLLLEKSTDFVESSVIILHRIILVIFTELTIVLQKIIDQIPFSITKEIFDVVNHEWCLRNNVKLHGFGHPVKGFVPPVELAHRSGTCRWHPIYWRVQCI